MKKEILTAKPAPRDANGDKIFPKIKWNNLEHRSWSATHIFREWDVKRKHYFEIIDIYSQQELEKRKDELKKKGIVLHKIFPWPDKPVPADFEKEQTMRSMTYYFFKEVLKFQYANNGGMNEWDINKLILRKSDLEAIQKLIKDNKLEKYGDLIFYLIAKIQDYYISEVEYYERPEVEKGVRNIEAETEELIKVIDRVSPDSRRIMEIDIKPDLKSISFIFPDIDPVKIESPALIRAIIEALKGEYNHRTYKNWKKDLRRDAKFHAADLEKKYYKNNVAIALHNLFTYLKLFPVKPGAKTSNKELLCIAKILEHGLMKIGSQGISEAEKIKNIRNWINPKRKELVTYPTHVETQPDMAMLEKYFDKKLLACVPLIKSTNKLADAMYIAERFEIHHLTKEICHLMDCFNQRNMQIGHQFTLYGKFPTYPQALKNFHKLAGGVALQKKKITELSFKVEGELKSQTIRERTPLLLIERALAEYYENHREEFDFDIMATEVTQSPDFSSYHVNNLEKYREQKERFMPQFCKNLYDLLLNEAPPIERDHTPSERYISIIAVFLKHCLLFNTLWVDEDIIREKVKQWRKDAIAIP